MGGKTQRRDAGGCGEVHLKKRAAQQSLPTTVEVRGAEWARNWA